MHLDLFQIIQIFLIYLFILNFSILILNLFRINITSKINSSVDKLSFYVIFFILTLSIIDYNNFHKYYIWKIHRFS